MDSDNVYHINWIGRQMKYKLDAKITSRRVSLNLKKFSWRLNITINADGLEKIEVK
jgi:hypothetical protein